MLGYRVDIRRPDGSPVYGCGLRPSGAGMRRYETQPAAYSLDGCLAQVRRALDLAHLAILLDAAAKFVCREGVSRQYRDQAPHTTLRLADKATPLENHCGSA